MARKIEVQIVGDASSLKRAVGQSESTLGRLGGTFGTLAKTAAFTAGAAGVGAIAITLRAGIREYTESAKVAAQTNAVIESTGGIANVTAKDVEKLADSLMRKSGVDDEAIKSSENLLLGFTNIRNEVGKGNDIFNQATAAVLDYSVRTGKDASGAAILFGKALNDPIGGLSKLARVGIQFTDAQKEQIKTMTEAGDVAGAQQVILAELEKRYGGAAEAAGKTLPGQLNVLKESFNNFAGDLISNAIPSVQRFVDFINTIVAAPTIKAKLTIAWEGLESVASDLQMKLQAQFASIDWADLFVSGFKAIDFSAVLMGVFEAIITVSKTQWQIVAAIWLGAWRAILTGLAAVGTQIVGAVTQTATSVAAAIRNGIAGIPGFVATVFQSVVTTILQRVPAAAAAALNLGQRIVSGVVSGLAGLAGRVLDKLNDIIRKIAETAQNAYSAAIGIGSSIISGVVAGLAGLIGRVGRAIADGVRSAVNWAKGHVGSTAEEYAAMQIGVPIAEGIMDGAAALLSAGLGGNLADVIHDGLDEFKDLSTGNLKNVGEQVASDIKGAMDEHLASNLPSNLQGVFDEALAMVDWGGAMPGVSTAPAGRTQLEPIAPAPLAAAAAVTFNNYAPISSERDFEDMVRSALNNVTGRQGYA